MKHKKIIPLTTSDGCTFQCLLGNMSISTKKFNNKDFFVIEPSTNNKYTLSLVKSYKNNYRDVEDVKFKTMQDAINAVEKVCNEFYNTEIKFWFQ